MTTLQSKFTNEWSVSPDGTRIGYRKTGNGPGLILLHGGLQSSLNFTELANALSHDFTVYVPDRRGRGLSGPYQANDNLLTEARDLVAIIQQTKATNIFGLSSGAIITLQALLLEHNLQKVALYEPPLAIVGHPFAKMTIPYQKAIREGNYGKAFLSILKGTGDDSFFSKLPEFLIAPLMNRQMNKQLKKAGTDEQVPLQLLVQNFRQDLVVINDSERLSGELNNIQAKILLMGGAKSLNYFSQALDVLETTLPDPDRIQLEKVGHLAADNSEQPLKVGQALLDFFKN